MLKLNVENTGHPGSLNEHNIVRYAMKKTWASVIMVFLWVALLMSGCAQNDKSMFTVQDEHYQQIMERQKAGMELEPQTPVDLTQEMDLSTPALAL